MAHARDIAIVLLAAGQSRRMGRDKLYLPLPNGKCLLEDRLDMLRLAGLPVYVALREDDAKGEALVRDRGMFPVFCPAPDQGMGKSLALAVHALPEGFDILVTLADLPAQTTDDMLRIAKANLGDVIVRASEPDGTMGHPVLFPDTYRKQLVALSGEHGARDVISGQTVRAVSLPKGHATKDMDTEQAYRSWCAQA